MSKISRDADEIARCCAVERANDLATARQSVQQRRLLDSASRRRERLEDKIISEVPVTLDDALSLLMVLSYRIESDLEGSNGEAVRMIIANLQRGLSNLGANSPMARHYGGIPSNIGQTEMSHV